MTPYPAAIGAPIETRWIRIIDQVAARTDELADDYVRLFSESSHYLRVVSGLDLWNTARDTMELLLLQLAEQPIPGFLQGLATNLGSRRARQGVSLDELLAMIRLDFQILWDGLNRVADEQSLQVLVRHVNHLHSTVEDHVSEVRSAYVLEEARLQRDSKIVATRSLSRLLKAGDEVHKVAPMVAEEIGIGLHAHYEVAFVDAEDALTVQRKLATSEAALRHLSWECTTGVVLLREQTQRRDWQRDLPGVSGAFIRDVPGLAHVPDAMERSQFIASHARSTSGSLVTADDVWLAVVGRHLKSALPGLCADVADGLDILDKDERERVLEAFFSYAATGSVKSTAENLYCHRNTIVNKLRVFRECTGLDPAKPAQAVKALVALESEQADL